MTRKSQRKLIKKKRLFVLRPKTNHGWCRPALFDLVKGPFISKRISFSFAIKKTGKKSNTQKRAMYIGSNFASWEQNNLWPKCFFKKKIHICIPIRWDYFCLKIWLNSHMITLSTFFYHLLFIFVLYVLQSAQMI